jgi:predicted NBD/HSP70 family sugar kinase
VRQLVVENGKYSPVRAQEIVNKAEAGDPTAQQQKAVLDEALRYGAAMTFRYVAILPAILVFLFGVQFLYYRARGGYTTVDIGGH